MGEWINVHDLLPDDKQRVLCYMKNYYELVLCFCAKDNTWRDLEDCWYDVDYWMPLPEPPKEE